MIIIILVLLTTFSALGMKKVSLPPAMTQGQADKHDDFLNAIERKDIFYISRCINNKEVDVNGCIQNQVRSGSGSICYSRKGVVPLSLAIEKGQQVIVTKLLDAGAHIDKPDDNFPLAQALEIVLEKGLGQGKILPQEHEIHMEMVDLLLAHGADISQLYHQSKRTVFHRIALYMSPYSVKELAFTNTWKVYFRFLMGLLQKELSEQLGKSDKSMIKKPLDVFLDTIELIFKIQDANGKNVYDIACSDGCAQDMHVDRCKRIYFDRAYIAHIIGCDAWREFGITNARTMMASRSSQNL